MPSKAKKKQYFTQITENAIIRHNKKLVHILEREFIMTIFDLHLKNLLRILFIHLSFITLMFQVKMLNMKLYHSCI